MVVSWARTAEGGAESGLCDVVRAPWDVGFSERHSLKLPFVLPLSGADPLDSNKMLKLSVSLDSTRL